MTGKVTVFIDGGYLDHLRDHRRVGWLDLEKLVHSAVDERVEITQIMVDSCQRDE